MKKLLIVAALACAPVFAVTPDGTFDQREKELLPQCDGLGGCAVIARAQLEQYVAALRQQWEAEIREQFNAAAKVEARKICKNTI
jgi:hypothetical protein